MLEATSVYPVGLTVALAAAGFPAAVMNPEQPHAFLRSEGQRTNTDRTDARLLARVGQQSGTRPARGGIRGGRAPIRTALVQLAQTAVVPNGVIAAHYQQLRHRMPHTPAIIASARRMLGLLNAMLHDGLRWEDTKVGQGPFVPHHP